MKRLVLNLNLQFLVEITRKRVGHILYICQSVKKKDLGTWTIKRYKVVISWFSLSNGRYVLFIAGKLYKDIKYAKNILL